MFQVDSKWVFQIRNTLTYPKKTAHGWTGWEPDWLTGIVGLEKRDTLSVSDTDGEKRQLII